MQPSSTSSSQSQSQPAANGSKNPFADIEPHEILKQPNPKSNAAPTSPPEADSNANGSTNDNHATSAPATSSAPPTAAPSSASNSVQPQPRPRPYDPRAALAQLDPVSAALPDEGENDRLTSELQANVATLMQTKQENERKQQKVGSVLASKYKRMEEEQRKLTFIRNELAKLDQSLAKNINMLRAEIETVGREVHRLQKDFDYKEKEYLAARKVLAKTKQRKLLLTAHLDYIILTNEKEKAQKLTELEVSLGLSPTPADDSVEGAAAATLAAAKPSLAIAADHTVASRVAAAAASSSSSSSSSTNTTPTQPRSPTAAPIIRSGPSPAALAAAAESDARHRKLLEASAIPPDHPGLKLENVAPPEFEGFKEKEQDTGTSVLANGGGSTEVSSNPFAPASTTASISSSSPSVSSSHSHTLSTRPPPRTAQHVSPPPYRSSKSNSITHSTLNSTFGAPAQRSLSFSSSSSSSDVNTLPDGTFAGFSD